MSFAEPRRETSATLRRVALVLGLLMSTQLGGCAVLRDFWAGLFKSAPNTASAPAATDGAKGAKGAANAATQVTAAPATGSAVASAAPTTSAAAAANTAAIEPPPRPLSASTQRAWDEALRQMRAGQTAEAERALRELARTEPDLGGVHANLGVLLQRQGRLDEAVAAHEQAVKHSPRQPVFHNQLGVACREAGRFEQARRAYERAIELDPAYAAPVLNLGILNDMYLGDAPRALELYTRYLVMTPTGDAGVTKWVAELKNRKGTSHTAQVSPAVRQEKP